MSDDKTTSTASLPAVTLEPSDHDGRIRRTGEALPHTGLEHEVSNGYLSKQVSELQRLIEDGFTRTLAALNSRIDGLATVVDEHHGKLIGHDDAFADHEHRLGKLDKRVTILESAVPADAVTVPATYVTQALARPGPPSYLRLATFGLAWLAMAALVVTLIVVGISRAL